MKRKTTWGDNDRRFGPILYSRSSDDYKPFAVLLDSGTEDESCTLRLSACGHTVIFDLPAIIKPTQIRTHAQSWDEATIERLGRDYYIEEFPRRYGMQVNDGFVQLFCGGQTHDSITTKDKCFFLPWTQLRLVKHTLFNPDGVPFWVGNERSSLTATMHAQKTCPTVTFKFADFDGEIIHAKTYIEEREYRYGTGKFKWTAILLSPVVTRTLEIEFSSEVGRGKGSWKGGTVGHAIELRHDDETHELAFIRYCALHGLQYKGIVS